MKFIKTILVATALSTATVAAAPAFAATQEAAMAEQSGTFERRSKRLQGDWTIETRGDKKFIVFSDDFRAAGGPDLKVFLSPTAYADVTGKTAVDGSVLIGELKKKRGVQEYEIPAGVDLADYSSILVHCEQYAVLWGGSDL